MDVVLKLRELRRMRGLTQKEAAELAGVGEKTVSSFETGDRIMSIKLSQLLQLLSAYSITPQEFFGDGVEQQLFSELERLTAGELKLLKALRALPEHAREPLVERFFLMAEAAAMAAGSRLRAVR
jgi:transcriptional regulator with XRE-family HTH domain